MLRLPYHTGHLLYHSPTRISPQTKLESPEKRTKEGLKASRTRLKMAPKEPYLLQGRPRICTRSHHFPLPLGQPLTLSDKLTRVRYGTRIHPPPWPGRTRSKLAVFFFWRGGRRELRELGGDSSHLVLDLRQLSSGVPDHLPGVGEGDCWGRGLRVGAAGGAVEAAAGAGAPVGGAGLAQHARSRHGRSAGRIGAHLRRPDQRDAGRQRDHRAAARAVIGRRRHALEIRPRASVVPRIRPTHACRCTAVFFKRRRVAAGGVLNDCRLLRRGAATGHRDGRKSVAVGPDRRERHAERVARRADRGNKDQHENENSDWRARHRAVEPVGWELRGAAAGSRGGHAALSLVLHLEAAGPPTHLRLARQHGRMQLQLRGADMTDSSSRCPGQWLDPSIDPWIYGLDFGEICATESSVRVP